LLLPLGDVEIDLGQYELVDEVLGIEAADCAGQYVVSTYMTAAPARRTEAVRKATSEVSSLGHLRELLREMERVAVEPLPQFDDFLKRWRGVVGEEAGRQRRGDWDSDKERWLREVVRRMEGAEVLGKLARSTKRAEDLWAWCNLLVETEDWKAALPAYEEAGAKTREQEVGGLSTRFQFVARASEQDRRCDEEENEERIQEKHADQSPEVLLISDRGPPDHYRQHRDHRLDESRHEQRTGHSLGTQARGGGADAPDHQDTEIQHVGWVVLGPDETDGEVDPDEEERSGARQAGGNPVGDAGRLPHDQFERETRAEEERAGGDEIEQGPVHLIAELHAYQGHA
jgi:hypothetical protein